AGCLAEPQRQLVEERERLRPSRIDGLAGLEHRRTCVDDRTDIEARLRGRDDRPVVKAETVVEVGPGDRDLDLDRRVADPDRLARLESQLAFAFDLLAG